MLPIQLVQPLWGIKFSYSFVNGDTQHFVLRTIPTIGIVIGSLLSLMGLIWLVSQGEPMLFLARELIEGNY